MHLLLHVSEAGTWEHVLAWVRHLRRVHLRLSVGSGHVFVVRLLTHALLRFLLPTVATCLGPFEREEEPVSKQKYSHEALDGTRHRHMPVRSSSWVCWATPRPLLFVLALFFEVFSLLPLKFHEELSRFLLRFCFALLVGFSVRVPLVLVAIFIPVLIMCLVLPRRCIPLGCGCPLCVLGLVSALGSVGCSSWWATTT